LTLARGRDLGLIRNAGDGTLILRRLGISEHGAVLSVNTGEVLVVTLARLKGTILGIVGGVVGTSDTVETVFAEVGCVRVGRITDFDAEGIAAHEAEFQQGSVIDDRDDMSG
jgi:hypothetical protein